LTNKGWEPLLQQRCGEEHTMKAISAKPYLINGKIC